MRYLGGKTRLAKYIAPVVLPYIKGRYIEPFVGSAAVAQKLAKLGVPSFKMQLSDNSYDLILLYQGLQSGWIPPENISLEEYTQQQGASPSSLRGFVGYGCSWGGKFFGGYARGENRNYAKEARNSLLKTINLLEMAQFMHIDYQYLHPLEGSCIYCDPPYANSTKYRSNFNHKLFWNIMRKWSKTCTVFISEYVAPEDFVSIWEADHFTSVRSHNISEKRIEKLFLHKSLVST